MVVPSRQRAAAVRLAYAAKQRARGRSVWNSPNVRSIGGWVQELALHPARAGLPPSPRSLPKHEEWVLWREAAGDLLASEPSLEGSALSADTLADALLRAAALAGDWGIPMARLTGQGIEAGWLSRAMAKVEAAARAVGAEPGSLLPKRAATIAQTMDPRTAMRVRYAGVALPAALRPLRAAEDEDLPSGVPGTPQVVASADPPAEWRAAARWCRERLEADPRARLLVVIPDLAQRRPLVERVFREVLNPRSFAAPDPERDDPPGGGRGPLSFALEGGQPLADYPEPRAMLQWLRLLSRPCDESDIAAALEAPWWRTTARGPRARAAARLREVLPRRVAPPRVAERLRSVARRSAGAGEGDADAVALEPIVRGVAAAAAGLAAGPLGPAEHWASVIDAALRALGWSIDAAPDSDTQQIRDRWLSLLQEFAGVLRIAPCRAVGPAVDLLTALARRESFAPSSGDPPVLVTAATEPPVVRYDGIRVCGLQADRWPAPVSVDPFIPVDLQRAAGVPESSASGQRARAAVALAAWRSCTDELVLSWALGENDAEWLPSPLLTPWMGGIDVHGASFKAAVRQAREADEAVSLVRRLRGTGRPSRSAPGAQLVGLPWPADAALPGGAGTLEDQRACPFRAYARRRLAAAAEDLAEEGLTALDRGRLLHGALNVFWGRVGDREALRAMSPARRRELLAEAVASAIAALQLVGEGEPLRMRLVERETARTIELGLAALEVDAARTAFSVALREAEIEGRIGSALLAMRVDRADRLPDGGLAIIDYKSGAPARLVWKGDEMTAVQLWAYALVLEARGDGPIAGLGNFHISRRGIGYEALARTGEVLPGAAATGWEDACEDARPRLAALADAFMAGSAEVAPRKGACEHCDLPALCRKAELEIDGWEMADDGGAGA